MSKKYFWVSLLCLLLVLTSCRSDSPPDPEETVLIFWESFLEGDYEEASLYVSLEADRQAVFPEFSGAEDGIFDDAEFSGAFMDRIQISTAGHEVDERQALVDVVIIWPDLDIFIGNIMADAMEAIFSLAFSGASAEELEQALKKLFLEALTKTPDIITEHQTLLVLEEGVWKLSKPLLPEFDAIFELPDMDFHF